MEQPTRVAGDNFNSTRAGLDTLAIHVVGGSSGMLGTQSSQAGGLLDPHVVKTKGRTTKRAKGSLEAPRSGDASWDCKFFRWLDDKGHSRSDIKIESHPHTESITQQHKDIVVDFEDLSLDLLLARILHLEPADVGFADGFLSMPTESTAGKHEAPLKWSTLIAAMTFSVRIVAVSGMQVETPHNT
ncbi:hypothetical protein ACLOJK_041132 [Asimina triloba]